MNAINRSGGPAKTATNQTDISSDSNLNQNNNFPMYSQAFFRYTAENVEQNFFHINKLYKLPWGKLAANLAQITAELSGDNDFVLYHFFPNGYPINQYRFYTGYPGCFITADGIFEDYIDSQYFFWPLLFADESKTVRQACLEIIAVMAYEFQVREAFDVLALVNSNFAGEFPVEYRTVFEGVA